jgi:hypothetical protein
MSSYTLQPVVAAGAALVVLPSGVALDPNLGVQPIVWQAVDMLYGWPLTQDLIGIDTGGGNRADFTIRFAFCRLNQGEAARRQRQGAISTLIDAGVDAIVHAFVTNRTSASWDWVHPGHIEYDAVQAHDVRGAYVDVTGYRILND